MNILQNILTVTETLSLKDSNTELLQQKSLFHKNKMQLLLYGSSLVSFHYLYCLTFNFMYSESP